MLGAGCVVQSHRLLRRLRLAPQPEQRPHEGDAAETLLRWNERALLASQQMSVSGPAISALARVSIMSGTAVALLLVAQRDLTRGGLAFGGGLVATLWVSQIGRLASEHATKLRRQWGSAGRRQSRR